MKLVIITGMSGAGKSQAVRCMEDLGFYCLDNLPPILISKFVELCGQSQGDIEKIALVIDIRGGMFFDDLFTSLEGLTESGYDYEILFLDASDEVLLKRFKETRRKHPLSATGGIGEGILEERKRLTKLREMATNIIDTSKLTPGRLKEEMRNIYSEGNKTSNLLIHITSFGFKHGIPLDSDLVFDVRFLPNPYYIENLRDMTGSDAKIRDYVMNYPLSQKFSLKLFELIDFLIPHYIMEGKNQLVISVGCTGGKHRSVTIAHVLYKKLKEREYRVILNHRDERLGERKRG